MIFDRLPLSSSAGSPRRPSFPPSAQSRRARPPAEVSPDTPAFITSYLSPSLSRRCWSNIGYASAGDRPRPAVRLSPRMTTRGRVATGLELGRRSFDACAAAGAAEAAGRDEFAGSRELHAASTPAATRHIASADERQD